MNEEWYRKEIAKLIVIIESGQKQSGIIAREYVLEKLNRIFNGYGISIHPALKIKLQNIMVDKNLLRRDTI